jgi:hypothetical protein
VAKLFVLISLHGKKYVILLTEMGSALFWVTLLGALHTIIEMACTAIAFSSSWLCSARQKCYKDTPEANPTTSEFTQLPT